MRVRIRQAQPCEHELLTKISFAAKRHWDYPESYFDVWKNELTISEAYIEDNAVFAAEHSGAPVAYYSIVQVEQDFFAGKTFVEKGFWLEHMFVTSQYIGKGIGTAMYAHTIEYCRDNGIAEFMIFADPNAKGFYDKQGAKYLQERPSSIEGRTVSLYIAKV